MANDKPRKPPLLARYTDLLIAIESIKNETITLVSPDLWEDKNDSSLVTQAQIARGCRIHALCMTESAERHHFWKALASPQHGVCVEYDREEFERYVLPSSRCILKNVDYVKLSDINSLNLLQLDEIIFKKRFAYNSEKEIRLSHVSSIDTGDFMTMPMPRYPIKRITLSPHMSENLADVAKVILQSFFDGKPPKIQKPRLTQSESWQRAWERKLKSFFEQPQ